MKNQSSAAFASAGLILFNASASFELLAPGNSLEPIMKRYAKKSVWKTVLREAFEDAYKIDYEAIFLYAIQVLDTLPTNPVTEAALEELFNTSQYISSRAGLLKLDLTGRIYHSALGWDLAKSFATYYTGIPGGELLAWTALRSWDEKVADFACGSGTLLLAAYHKKLSITFLDPANHSLTVDDLHKKFVEDDIIGLDGMPFAAHLTLVNLSMQQPAVVFKSSNILHVPVNKGQKPSKGKTTGVRLGSLDLLRSGINSITVQRRISGPSIGPVQKELKIKTKRTKFILEPESLDLVLMNPPFTKKQRVSQILNETALKELLGEINPKYKTSGGQTLPFILLGDKYLKPGGRMALVLPATVIQRSSMEAIRELLFDKYDIEHIMLKWVKKEIAFSENTDIREILLIIRKRYEGMETTNHTLITHIDEHFTFMEARQIADQIIVSEQKPSVISIKGRIRQPIFIGIKQMGEIASIPRVILDTTLENWYQLVSYRKFDLVRCCLIQQNLLYDSNPPYNLNLSSFLTILSDEKTSDQLTNVGLFVKQVSSAGFRVSNDPVPGGLKALMTSDYDKLVLDDHVCSYLVKDPSLKATDSFNPGLGHLLIPRKVNLASTARVFSIVSDDLVTGNMWIPIEANCVRTVDGRELTSIEVSRILALWLMSTFGIMLFISRRFEIEGAWVEWLTNDTRKMMVLDPRLLTTSQVDQLLDCWARVENVNWSLITDQFAECAENITPNARLDIDKTILTALGIDPNTISMNEIYTDLKNEIILLKDIM